MFLNNGSSAVNNPSFSNATRGMLGSKGSLGTPLSSSSRMSSKLLKGRPPQNLSSYLAKYQPQLGSRFSNLSRLVIDARPQISKATVRFASGILLSIVSTLGSFCGTGNGPAGSAMSTGSPSTTMVARDTG